MHYCCLILTKLEFSEQIFEKYSNIKLHENLSIGSRVVACGRMDGQTDRQTDVMKPLVTFGNFANAPKKTEVIAFFKRALKFACGNESTAR
jgi:hypothetical protein